MHTLACGETEGSDGNHTCFTKKLFLFYQETILVLPKTHTCFIKKPYLFYQETLCRWECYKQNIAGVVTQYCSLPLLPKHIPRPTTGMPILGRTKLLCFLSFHKMNWLIYSWIQCPWYSFSYFQLFFYLYIATNWRNLVMLWQCKNTPWTKARWSSISKCI